ncbi:MAG: hypothetical protein QOF76_1664, partial [Solirubrobacteraceae bacterium]|nr:hypothetical protein [Solirubrobacteraceae bacterium]
TRREQAESDLADGAGLPEDELTHGRRAEKAGYLAEKLKEQAESNER